MVNKMLSRGAASSNDTVGLYSDRYLLYSGCNMGGDNRSLDLFTSEWSILCTTRQLRPLPVVSSWL